MNRFDYKPPRYNDLKSMFYRVTSISHDAIKTSHAIFTSTHSSNNIKDVYLRTRAIFDRDYDFNKSLLRNPIATYGYYMNHKNEFAGEPNNVKYWMLLRMYKTVLSIAKANGIEIEEKYYKCSNQFLERHADKLMDALVQDAKIVAGKAKHIEDQRD